mmetsp:Transcript_157699/g.278364  ORF Transcript_157699/g.278364 Transcript_157699/m.278364 type:complete len:148 (+) Transcript_157699:69-512(+)
MKNECSQGKRYPELITSAEVCPLVYSVARTLGIYNLDLCLISGGLPRNDKGSDIVITADFECTPDERMSCKISFVFISTDRYGIVVIQDIPNSITSKHEEAVLRRIQIVHPDLGICNDKCSCCAWNTITLWLLHQDVAKSTGDSKTP